MKSRYLWVYSMLLILMLGSSAQCHNLIIELENRNVSYELNGDKTSLGKLMDLISDQYRKAPQDSVVIIFDGEIPLDTAENAAALFYKVGFRKVILFVRAREAGKMRKVMLGPPVLFEKNPKTD